ncbi:LytTR family DNA-binding domain-containing protein [Parasphingorhabdus sp.]|uniref:LytR/AlgR family response regulator transcription factor n=1 Tax=Parasphingorhabdus sp. TaxID=2709688 RepID=UPI003264160D
MTKKVDQPTLAANRQTEIKSGGQVTGSDIRTWQPYYWAFAGVIPFIFYAFDAAMRASYPETQAPNVSLTAQLLIMFGFYAIWMAVPRLVWEITTRSILQDADDLEKLLARVAVAGGLLCAGHLLILTIILRYLYSSPGWGVRELIYSYGEVCLGNAAIWLMAYAVAAAIIIFRIFSILPKDEQQRRYEVRQNGKIWSFPFDEIFWIKAAGNYAELHTVRGVMLVRKSLTQIVAEVAGGSFIQSHRSALINGAHVVAIKRQSDGSGYLVELSNDEFAPLSRRNHSDFREALRSVQ